jgi:hypothetical protein
MALVGNLVSCLWAKSETKSVTPDTAFRFNSKDLGRVVASDSKRGYLCSIVGSCLYLIWGGDRNL